jgi:hypothetical protein
MGLLPAATATEDSFFDAVKMAEDSVVHTARTLRDGFEPLSKRLPERPTRTLLPAPAEMANHCFDFVDRVLGNLRDFAGELGALRPSTAESRSSPAQPVSKARGA